MFHVPADALGQRFTRSRWQGTSTVLNLRYLPGLVVPDNDAPVFVPQVLLAMGRWVSSGGPPAWPPAGVVQLKSPSFCLGVAVLYLGRFRCGLIFRSFDRLVLELLKNLKDFLICIYDATRYVYGHPASIPGQKEVRMFSWGPFPTAPAVGGIFYGPVIDPRMAWSIVLVALIVSCGALWALRILSRAPEEERRTRREEVRKKAA
jgi:hypothetical protein